MAALCGLADPAGNGKDTYRKWEDGDGPSGPVAAFLTMIMAGIETMGNGEYDLDVGRWVIDHVRRRVGITPL